MLKIGQTIKVKCNYTGHNYTIGEKYKIINISNKSIKAKDINTGFIGNFIDMSEVEVIYSKEFEISLIKEYEDELRQIENKRNYLKKNKIQQSDEKNYYQYLISEALKSDKPEDEKIAELITLIKKII